MFDYGPASGAGCCGGGVNPGIGGRKLGSAVGKPEGSGGNELGSGGKLEGNGGSAGGVSLGGLVLGVGRVGAGPGAGRGPFAGGVVGDGLGVTVSDVSGT